MGLTERLKERALELGFDAVGVAAAGPATHMARYDAWLAAGHHGEMGWLATRRDERADPRLLVPQARSVIVLATSYHRPGHVGQPVARYALGRDYHNVVQTRLRKLRRFLGEEAGARAYAEVDTGPVLERFWAQEAGIGWIGKSANLVTRTHSSWVLLGFMVIDRELEPDTPIGEHCGSCRACLPACPTGAILAPGIVDARRCIAYLTIESREGMPRALRRAVGGRMFGCDDCQEVCPWEKFAPGTSPHASMAARADIVELRPRDVLALDDATMKARFEGSPLARPGPRGLRRNALVAVGNGGDPADVPAVARFLDDGDPMLRGHAVWALGALGARALVEAHLGRETDADVRAEALAVLEERP